MLSPISISDSAVYGRSSTYYNSANVGAAEGKRIFSDGTDTASENRKIFSDGTHIGTDEKRIPGDPRQNNERSGGIKPEDECQTCKKRKYKDGSNEMVSFKSPRHLSPENAASAVRAHEQEHVSNAYKKAAQNNGKVLSASVSIHRGICPECGRSYVTGGTTRTQIKYYNEDNPYQKALKSADSTKYSGMNLDYAV